PHRLAGRPPRRARPRRAGAAPGRRPGARTPGGRRVNQTFTALGTRNFRLFLGGQLVSNTGTWMQRVAQDWLVLSLSGGSGVALGLTTSLQFVPIVLFTLFGGVIADRLPKRKVLVCTQTAMGLQALTL